MSMYKVTNIDYEIIKDSALFDKEAERVYKMYTHPDIKIFVIEDRNKLIALCIAYVGEDNISLFHCPCSHLSCHSSSDEEIRPCQERGYEALISSNYVNHCLQGSGIP